MKRFTLMFLSLIMLLLTFTATACGKKATDVGIIEKVDTNRVQLYVGNYNGGYGDQWLRLVKERFEDKYKEVSFAPDTKGVQIMIDNNKSGFSGEALQSTIAGAHQEVFFTEVVFYAEYVSRGLLLDISDIVEQKLDEYGENRSIEEKLTDEQQAYYKFSGKYYGLPHYEAFQGLTYNVELFDNNLLYFAADGTGDSDGFITENGVKSNGPDGLPSTTDDGLPVTYEEFFKLCKRIKDMGMSPVSWTGQYQDYANMLLSALWSDYEGLDNVYPFYNLSGENIDIVDKIENGVVTTKKVNINSSNVYDFHKQAGRYYAYKFLKTIIDNGYFSNFSFTRTHSHMLTQADFLYSTFDAGEKIAMLLEGVWWEGEATDTFNEMEGAFGSRAAKSNRKFAFMPYPKATADKVGEPTTLLDTHMSAGFINANISVDKIDLAKLFFQFCHTDESLAEFTLTTGATKGFDYDISEQQYEQLSYFAKSLWDLRKNSDVGYSFSASPLYISNQQRFFYKNQFYSEIGNNSYNLPTLAMRDDNVSAEDYFWGTSNYFKKAWSNFV